jgi:hypothetical protein
MKRSTFDILMATAGLFLAVTLIAAGGMLTWAHTFIGNEVHTQLAAQQIFFPAANSKAVAAAVMLLLGGLGLVHARRVSPAAEILGGHPANGRTPVPVSGPADQA